MESGSIVSWEKKEGDKLNEGDLLCEIETDKATMGFETPEEGYLAKIIIPAGTKGVPVGKLLCIIVENQGDVAAFKDFKDDSSAAAPAPSTAPSPDSSTPSSTSASVPAPSKSPVPPQADQHSRVYASPMARRLAEIKKIRLQGTGSGLYGSLKSTDLAGMAVQEQEAFSAEPAAAAPHRVEPGQAYVDIPLSSMRATIAKRLTQAKQMIPHYQLTMTIQIDKTLAMRKEVNERLEKEKAGIKLSVNDFIIKAVASACKRVPAVNAHWMDTFIRQYSNVDVSVAVATPSGLITPIIFSADSRGVIDISRSMKELSARAKEGRLKPEEFQGGTVTVSNLGMYGITMFNAIINPPQSFIIACGGLQDLIVPDSSKPEGWRVAKFASFTASADHRVIDGALGAEWMKAFKDNMENPAEHYTVR
ncbi:Dihydrolipoyllysine-residue acetyltransferase component of pyruvate dehydrogenase complex, mitochondrial [Eumeta japonica]|uniref:dihydrolipoyllysine-residue acetyltransferase n=1 Tax=Eumeta variegata TaxID=151549 RepID=A0A4C1VNU5_EUMVA|nr:Dihydrolipoyllysine-residue acetyltransferase component of pyruvate dehydrogenase complex, mitochondrial [Eumeta japonica]